MTHNSPKGPSLSTLDTLPYFSPDFEGSPKMAHRRPRLSGDTQHTERNDAERSRRIRHTPQTM